MGRMARKYRKHIAWIDERLAELAQLEPDWDSYGALPPSPRALSMARAMVERAVERFGERGIPGEVMPIADGAVQLEWRFARLELGLNACTGGGWSYLRVEKDGEGRRFEEAYDLSDEDALALIASLFDEPRR